MIDTGKRSNALGDVKPAKNINNNREYFLGKVICKRKFLFYINCKIMHE